ncbi:MAG: hypothetical protein JNN07_07805 [Verrucomicrobiales bacterium]|nr:hypothetical protein [Verrucomicrobiales bacterium]
MKPHFWNRMYHAPRVGQREWSTIFSLLVLLFRSLEARAASADPGDVDTGFQPQPNGLVASLAVQSDGQVLAGGSFTQVGGTRRDGLARLGSNGALDNAFKPSMLGSADFFPTVASLAVQVDGKVLLGGDFEKLDGKAQSFLGRVMPNGTIDPTFRPEVDFPISALFIQSSGKIAIGGLFTSVGVQPWGHLARLSATGDFDAAFNPRPNDLGLGYAFGEFPDGRLLVGGGFTQIAGAARMRLARFGSNGSLDVSYVPAGPVNGAISALVIQPDQKVLLAGSFTSVNGIPRNRIARLNADGTLDSTFDPNANNSVTALALQPDGKIVAGGLFSSLAGKARSRIGRLNPDGSIDVQFDPGANGNVRALAVQPRDGKILIGGEFTELGKAGLTYLGRIHGAARYTIGQSISRPPLSFAPDAKNPDGPVSSIPADAFCWDPSTRKLYALNSGSFLIRWVDPQDRPLDVPIIIDPNPAQSVSIGAQLPPPDGFDLSRVPAIGPLINPSDAAIWHNPSRRLFALKEGPVSVTWGLSEASCPRVPMNYSVSWPNDPTRFQTHVAQTPPVALDNGGLYTHARVFQEAGVGTDASEVSSSRRFSASGPGRSVLLLSQGDPRTSANVAFQFVKTVRWDDPAYLQDNVQATIGEEIDAERLGHDLAFGGPAMLVNSLRQLSRYCAAPGYYDPVTRQGPIIPVNRDRSDTATDDLVLVLYEGASRLWNPLTSSLGSAGDIGWPSKAVRYRPRWPEGPDTIVIANERGGSLAGLKTPTLYVQNDPALPGFNPNEEHALLFAGRGRQPQLRLDKDSVVVVEGSVATASLSVLGSDPPTENIVVSISPSRTGAPELLASFDRSAIVTATNFTTANWNHPKTIYFLARTNFDSAESVNGSSAITLTASGGLFGRVTVPIREADTNELQLVVDATALSVPEGGSRTLNVRLTQPPMTPVSVGAAHLSGDLDLDAGPVLLRFTSENWNVPQSIFVSAEDDQDLEDGQATFRLTASGGLVSTVTVTATEQDDELPSQAVYALRDDLGDRPGTSSPQYSEPYVLLTYLNPANQPSIKVYRVVAETNSQVFRYSGIAGRLIQPPYPVSQFLGWETNTTAVRGPYWRDRKQFYWARAAGDDGGPAEIVMRFFYPKVRDDFFFPPGFAPAGTAIPWLDRRPGGTPGVPTDMRYQITWPEDVPELRVGETLVKAKFGLPSIRGQTSVDVVYEQSSKLGAAPGSSARLIDASHLYSVPLEELPPDMAGKTVTNLLDGTVFFVPLPPHLRSRVWWVPSEGKLNFNGRFVEEFGTEEPSGYLLLNVLNESDLDDLKKLSNAGGFVETLSQLALRAGQVRVVPDNTVQTLADTFALTAGLASRAGYVTLAFNNVIQAEAGLPAGRGSPVSLDIIRVNCPLYRGDTKVLYPDDPFDEKVTLRHSGDFGGQADGYLFDWQYHAGPTKPAPDSPAWINLTPAPELGAVTQVISGSGARSLGDWWYRCRWRTTNSANPCGTGFTAFTEPALVEGWIKRVLANINFFNQRYADLVNSSADTIVNVISQAGTRWVGKVPLNAAALQNSEEFGLIEIYETILKRGIEMSIEGTPPVKDMGANRALLQAAAQLANIYLLLGNEAYADAADPTIGFVTTGGDYGVEASSVHCFMDQAGIDSLLMEELALLRGLDDSFRRNVRVHPVYNRLPPSMAAGFQAEPAYVLNYNIKDRSGDGRVDAADAQTIWPQGHGDAWGHYLTAIQNFYRLLRNPEFEWTVTHEFVKLAGGVGEVPVNYQHERKFAEVAAAKARTGAELVNLTYRSRYVEDPDGQWQGYLDANLERSWGLSEWASRAGQGAFFDWLTGNALLPPVAIGDDTIKVDRTTVTELREIVGSYTSIQDELDKADAGLNPLGIAKNVIPFDIDPARVEAGETHFEQILDRARRSMNNAIGVFNRANASTQRLRGQADTIGQFQDTVRDRENDFTNRLVEVFGYPYPDDPAYAAAPNGPDLLHYMYHDYSEITGEVPPLGREFTVLMTDTEVDSNGNLTRRTVPVTYHLAANGLGLVKPSTWTRARRAPGELQMAHSDLLQVTARFRRALTEYEGLLAHIEDQAALLRAQYNLDASEVGVLRAGTAAQDNLNASIRRSRSIQLDFQKTARIESLLGNALAEALPTSAGFSFDPTSLARSAILLSSSVKTEIFTGLANEESLVELVQQQAKESAQNAQNIELTTLRHEQGVLQQIAQIEQLLRQEASLRLELYTQQEAMQQASGRFASTLSRGQRLLEERLRFRQKTAEQVQEYRYKDMAFRVFRNEALQQYRAQFDMAARYVYFAAAAYDFETNLRDTESRWTPGAALLTDIVRARSVGVIDGTGNPQPGPGAGRRGDGGLAAALWAMNNNWSDAGRNLKGQLGFNNASREQLTFSMRAGLFRSLTNDAGSANWRAWLSSLVVPDVSAIPEFNRYCKPPAQFGLGGRKEPGIVIPFGSAILFRHNFFGWPESGGGANFSSSYFATKIRSAGVRLIGYDASALNSTPYVYLVPVGNDVLLSPITLGAGAAVSREWKILDQFMPPPLSTEDLRSSFPAPLWTPIADNSQGEPFLAIRRYSQMRAFHDGGLNGTPTNPELQAYKRLVGRSVWNTRWLLIILGGDLLGVDPDRGIRTFVQGALGDGEGLADILLEFSTYSYSGN